jgi:hypothetical protein
MIIMIGLLMNETDRHFVDSAKTQTIAPLANALSDRKASPYR